MASTYMCMYIHMHRHMQTQIHGTQSNYWILHTENRGETFKNTVPGQQINSPMAGRT